jgi:release factor glutamine methyltransferase
LSQQLRTIRELLPQAATYLEGRGIRSPRLDAEHLLAHTLGLKRLDLYLEHDRPLVPSEVDAFRELIRRRGRREPLAYLLGSWGFRTLDLRTDRRALVPRPETELLVEHGLDLIRETEAPRCLDVGTGTGAIALALAKERPDARVFATDVSGDALALAAENAERNGLTGRVELRRGDLLSAFEGERFDLIAANLPYVAEGDQVDDELAHEPDVAVYAETDGRELLARLADAAPGALEPGGAAIFEVGQGQASWLADRLAANGLAGARVEEDLAGIERIVLGRRQPT